MWNCKIQKKKPFISVAALSMRAMEYKLEATELSSRGRDESSRDVSQSLRYTDSNRHGPFRFPIPKV